MRRAALTTAHYAWLVLAVTACVWGSAQAQTGEITVGGLSPEFIVGSILTVGLTAVGAWAKRLDDELRQLRRDFTHEIALLRREATERSDDLEAQLRRRTELHDMESRQIAAQIQVFRETVFREYPNKADTDRHRDKLERALEQIHSRLDRLGAPPPNRSTSHGTREPS